MDADRFRTTTWNTVHTCGDGKSSERDRHNALGEVCQIYWRPIFYFICCQGYETCDAEDLTQDFFVKILEGKLIEGADPQRGRFRALLLTALKRFLSTEKVRDAAARRGGSITFLSFEYWMTQAPSSLALSEQYLREWPPERIFDVRWAATMVERALEKLRQQCERRGRRRLFDALSGYLGADREDVDLVSLARRTGTTPDELRLLLFRLRNRYRVLLREEVEKTLYDRADVDDELRHLCNVLAVAA